MAKKMHHPKNIIGLAFVIIKPILNCSNPCSMALFRLNEFCLMVLVSMAFSCGVPLPTDRTVVYASRDVGYYKFKPVLKEKYKGDTLTVSNYLIANVRTGSYFRGIKSMEIDEDSVLSKILDGMGKLNLTINQSDNLYNIFNFDIVSQDKHSWNRSIENNVLDFISEVNKMEGKLNLIPSILYKIDHDASSFNGPGDVNVRYSVFFMVVIFNDKKELIFKDGSGIGVKSESIWHWEEALAFPIEKRVTEAHFEEMILEALREYINQ